MSLVLTRKPNQKVILTDPSTGVEITMTIHNVRGTQIQIGFEAPSRICIDREEVYHAKKENIKQVA